MISNNLLESIIGKKKELDLHRPLIQAVRQPLKKNSIPNYSII